MVWQGLHFREMDGRIFFFNNSKKKMFYLYQRPHFNGYIIEEEDIISPHTHYLPILPLEWLANVTLTLSWWNIQEHNIMQVLCRYPQVRLSHESSSHVESRRLPSLHISHLLSLTFFPLLQCFLSHGGDDMQVPWKLGFDVFSNNLKN